MKRTISLLMIAGMATIALYTLAPHAGAQTAPGKPIVTGQFPEGPAVPTLVLVNQSSLDDASLANISVGLTKRIAGVAVATRLSGQSCAEGEWCLAVTDAMMQQSRSREASGAAVGAEVMRAITVRFLAP